MMQAPVISMVACISVFCETTGMLAVQRTALFRDPTVWCVGILARSGFDDTKET